MVIIFVLNSGFSDRNHIHDSGPAEIRISEHFVFFPALAGLKMLICWRGTLTGWGGGGVGGAEWDCGGHSGIVPLGLKIHFIQFFFPAV